jgi:hypothetical protein
MQFFSCASLSVLGIFKYSKICPKWNRQRPNLLSTSAKFPHYTKMQKKNLKSIKIMLHGTYLFFEGKLEALDLVNR